MTVRASLGNLRLDPVTSADARELYRVRMHPSVRQFMSNPVLIPFSSHRAWFGKHLSNPDGLQIWLIRTAPGSRAIGLSQLRTRSDTSEIGVMLREPKHHRLNAALVTATTLYLAYLHVPWVISYVIPEHKDAIEFNLAWGASIVPSDKAGLVKLQLHRDVCRANNNFARIFARVEKRLVIEEIS